MRRRTFFFALLVGALAGGAHPLRVPAATNTPHCRAIDLRASARWHHAKTVLQGIIIITNRAAMGCRLLVGTDGQPTIDLLDSGGHPLPLRPPKLSGPHIFTPYGGFFVLHPGQQGSLSFWWSNWCGRIPMTITIRAGLAPRPLTVTTRVRGDAPPCLSHAHPSVIDVGDLTF